MLIDFSARGGKMGTDYGFCRGAHPDLTEIKKKRLGARAEKGTVHYDAVPVGARIARPRFVQHSLFAQ